MMMIENDKFKDKILYIFLVQHNVDVMRYSEMGPCHTPFSQRTLRYANTSVYPN